MAKKTPEEQLDKWLRKHPKADQAKLDKFLGKHDDIAALFVQETMTTPDPLPPPPADTGLDSPAPDPTPDPAPAPADERTAGQKFWDWLKNNPLVPKDAADTVATNINLGIWTAAVAVLAWLIMRKKKR